MKLTKAAAVLSAVMIAGTTFVGAIVEADGKDVTVRYIDRFSGSDVSTAYKTQHKTVEEFLDENDIPQSEYDKLNRNNDDLIVDGTKITVTKAVPITVKTGDSIITATTTMPTVNQALFEIGMIPEESDVTEPAGDTPVKSGMQIVIINVTDEEQIETEYTDFDTIYRDDASIPAGETRIVQNGTKGQTKVTYKLIYKDGVLESREETNRMKISDPQAKIIAKGTKEQVQATADPQKTPTPQKSSAGKKPSAPETQPQEPVKEDEPNTINGLKYTKKMQMTATAYSAFRSNGSRANTASGAPARKGIVAVDRNVIPLGTRLYIEGYGEAIAGDVGGAVKGNIIDLCFEDTEKNLNKFGRQQVMVYFLE